MGVPWRFCVFLFSSRLLCRYMFAHLKDQEFVFKIACTNIECPTEFSSIIKLANSTHRFIFLVRFHRSENYHFYDFRKIEIKIFIGIQDFFSESKSYRN